MRAAPEVAECARCCVLRAAARFMVRARRRGTLTGAEAPAAARALSPGRLFSGSYYLNELLPAPPKRDRHEKLFDAYAAALGGSSRAMNRWRCAPSSTYCSTNSAMASNFRGIRPPAALDERIGTIIRAGRGVLAVRDADPVAAGTAGRDYLRSHAVISRVQRPLKAARVIYGAAIAQCLEGQGLAIRDVMLAMRGGDGKDEWCGNTPGCEYRSRWQHCASRAVARSPDPCSLHWSRNSGARTASHAPARGPPPHPGSATCGPCGLRSRPA